jgi:hypothetical protein
MIHLIQIEETNEGYHAMWHTRPNIKGCPLGRGHDAEASVKDLIYRTNAESGTSFDESNTMSSLSRIAWLQNLGPNVRLDGSWHSVNGSIDEGITDFRFRSGCKATDDYDKQGY